MTEQRTPPDGSAVQPAGRQDADPPVDLRRVAAVVRRNRRLVATVVLLVTGAVLVVTLLSPDRYRATARIAGDPVPGEAVDIETADRQLATSSELVTSPPVLAEAARRLPGESVASLGAGVSATFDPAVSILDVVATGEDPRRVARVANAVADTFLAESERVQARVARRARERLSEELDRLRRSGAPEATLDAMRERVSELAVTEVTADSGLRLVQRAATPTAPYAPRPLRSVVVAFFAALLLGLLVAIAREHLRPAAPDAAALSRVVGVPVIAALPAAPVAGLQDRLRRALGRPSRASRAVDQTIIEEAALQGAVRGALPPRGQRVVLVHSIDGHDGAAQVAEGLARSLAWGGHHTALVRFEADGGRPAADVPTLSCDDIDEQLEELKGTDYRYVVVQGPRLAAAVRLRPLAARSAAVVLVARLGEAATTDAAAARRLIDALGLRALGLVVICSLDEVPGIVRSSLATAPLRAPLRPRAPTPNGAHAEPAGADVESERAAG